MIEPQVHRDHEKKRLHTQEEQDETKRKIRRKRNCCEKEEEKVQVRPRYYYDARLLRKEGSEREREGTKKRAHCLWNSFLLAQLMMATNHHKIGVSRVT